MLIVSLIISFGTVALGLSLAFRLLRLAAHARTAPELSMGLYCLFVSIGALLLGAAVRGVPAESSAAVLLSAASTLCIGLAAFSLAAGIWRIFHPAETWARYLVIGVGLWLGASWIACVLPGRPVLFADLTPANGFFVAARVAVYAYGAFEAFRYSSMLRRRAALGLADPVAAHQILLWGIAWVCVIGVAVTSLLIVLAGGRHALESPSAMAVVSVVNAAAWVCTWLAFFPPRAYQRWVEGARAASAA